MADSLIKPAASSLGQKTADDKVMFNLETIGTHNVIEHDASLVHDDAALGNAYKVNNTLVENLLRCSSDGINLTEDDLVRYRKLRYNESHVENKNMTFGIKQVCNVQSMCFALASMASLTSLIAPPRFLFV
jgi:hypothetical protein